VEGGDNPVVGATLTATALGAEPPGIATLDILPLELSIEGLDGANFRGDQSELVGGRFTGSTVDRQPRLNRTYCYRVTTIYGNQYSNL